MATFYCSEICNLYISPSSGYSLITLKTWMGETRNTLRILTGEFLEKQ